MLIHRVFSYATLLTGVLAGAGSVTPALAAEGEPTSEPELDAETMEAPTGDAGPAEAGLSPEAAAAIASGEIACVLEYYPKRATDSSLTAARMVCDELRKSGLRVTQPIRDAVPEGEAYLLRLERLGDSIQLVLRHRAANGGTIRSKTIGIGRFEEAKQGVPRLVTALVENKDVEKTASYDNVLAEEARRRKKMRGEWVHAIGIVGTTPLVKDHSLGPGGEYSAYYQTAKWALGLGWFFEAETTDGSLVDGYLGARRYLSDNGFDLFAGGGVSLMGLEVGDAEGGGFTAFGEFGIEMFRLYSTHLLAYVRLDAPLFKLKDERDPFALDAPEQPDGSTRYEMPLSLHVAIGW